MHKIAVMKNYRTLLCVGGGGGAAGGGGVIPEFVVFLFVVYEPVFQIPWHT